MKLLLLIAIGVTIVTSAEVPIEAVQDWERNISGFKEKCIEETKVDPDLIYNMEKKLDFSKNEALKCYYYCIYKNAKICDDNGQFTGERYTNKISTVPLSLTTRCTSETVHLEGCEKAYQLAICIIKGLVV
ncbi:hypothetical protein RI129_002164 [Pyrocoelia pectoralis]|uniref:Uncharacterized protein n=1 Tax=Pyrocoelia pectoralis TaxID=417401 RepID=A0AAN7ZLU9_9COLE